MASYLHDPAGQPWQASAERGPRRHPGKTPERQPLRRRRDARHASSRADASRTTPNVLDVDCGNRSAAECFADLEARLLPALRDAHGGHPPSAQDPGALRPGLPARRSRTSSRASRRSGTTGAHAWVEVYFPGHGWVIFDPTGGNVAQAEPHPVRASRSRRPSPTPSAASRRTTTPDRGRPDQRRSPGSGRDRRPAAGWRRTRPVHRHRLLLLVDRRLASRSSPGSAARAARRRPKACMRGVTRTRGPPRFRPAPDPDRLRVRGRARRRAASDPSRSSRRSRPPRSKSPTAAATLGDDRIRALRESYRRLRVGLLRLLFRRRDGRR